MKKIIITYLIFAFTNLFYCQQNLVQNGSFEDMVSCPINGFITNCQGWYSYSSSPDYFNSCVPSLYAYSIPNNLHGFQSPASGQAYSGIYTYIEGETDYSLNREILGSNLVSSLIIGQKYYVSLKVSLGTNTPNTGHSLATNKIGALFSTVPFSNTNSSTIPPIENFAHVYTDSIIKDTINWTTVFGSFIADSFYTHISIGNFFKVNNTDTIHLIANNPFTPNSYYYIDDICVSTDSSFCANFLYTGLKSKVVVNKINVYPNPTCGNLKISLPNNNDSTTIEVFNLFGLRVYCINSKQITDLDLSFLEDGLYELLISNDKNQYKTKVIIQK